MNFSKIVRNKAQHMSIALTHTSAHLKMSNPLYCTKQETCLHKMYTIIHFMKVV